MAEIDQPKMRRKSPGQLLPDEAQDFTPWLAAHLGGLGSILGLQLAPEPTGPEVTFPGFGRVDMGAVQAEAGATLIIEKQLGASDNDHVVRSLDATGREAAIII